MKQKRHSLWDKCPLSPFPFILAAKLVHMTHPVAFCLSRRQYNLLSGEAITADLYVSAMPVDIVKKLMPAPWYQMDFFK